MIIPSLERLHTDRRDFALRLLSALGAPAHDVEDLAQETLLRFFTRGYGDRGLDERQEKALLARIAYTTYVDALRRRRCFSLDQELGEDGGWMMPPSTSGLVARVRDLVARARLTADEADLIQRRYTDGVTVVQIASDQGLHVNTVRRRLDAVLERLRRIARADEHKKTMTRSPQA